MRRKVSGVSFSGNGNAGRRYGPVPPPYQGPSMPKKSSGASESAKKIRIAGCRSARIASKPEIQEWAVLLARHGGEGEHHRQRYVGRGEKPQGQRAFGVAEPVPQRRPDRLGER